MTLQSSQASSTTAEARFRWQAMLRATALGPGWQDRLTEQFFAVASIRVTGRGPLLPAVLQAQVIGDDQRLYEVRVREGAVDVRVAYTALARAGVGLLPPCELLIKTTDGGQGVTLDPPLPPGQEEWQALVEQVWSQLQMEPQVRLDEGLAAPQAGRLGGFAPQSPLLSRFHLAPEVEVEHLPQHMLYGQRPPTWQREVRLLRDDLQPWLLRAQVGWREQATAPDALFLPDEPEDDLEMDLEPEDQPAARRAPLLIPGNGRQHGPVQIAWAAPQPAAFAAADWREPLKRKGGLMIAGVLLLALVVIAASVLAFGVFGSNRQARTASIALSQASPTATASDQSSPTAQPSDVTSPTPTTQATRSPTATPAPVVNWSVATQGSTSQRCSPHPNISPLLLTIDNSKSSAALTWKITITTNDPAGKPWASASPASGTLAAGQQAQITLTPISSLCPDMASATSPIAYHAVVSGTAAGQTKSVTITVTVKP